MRTLFLKIFLWFWLAMVLVSGTLILSVVTTQSQFTASRTAQSDRTITPLVAARAADVLDDHGMGALSDFLASLDTTLHAQAYLFDDEGKEILSQPAPPEAEALAQTALQTDETKIVITHGTKFVARRTIGSTGSRYVLVMSTAVESAADALRAPLETQFIRAAIVFLIAGLVCFWLARHITAPIRHIRAATHRLAAGHLGARVGGSAANRGDELADLSREFDHMAEQIEALISSQRRLIADISHELRSPLARLTVALGLTRLRANPESVSGLDRIELEAGRLDGLIGSLLRLARLESGSENIGHESIDLGALVRDVVADAEFEAQSLQRRVRLVHVDACSTSGNRQLLTSAIENVVRNAVGYTPEGTAVNVTVENGSGENTGYALIRVRDHGEGVPENSLGDIFLPFYRVGDSRDRSSGGSGLGLSITDRAVRLHGGSVTAENCPDGGLVVELRLPLEGTLPDRKERDLASDVRVNR
ncbi:MAG: ATP-binding protein [Candidatus Acidiferrales bacterium]